MELLRDYRVLQPASSLGPLDQTTSSGVDMETLEEPANPCGTAPETGCIPQLCNYNRVFPQGTLAYEHSQVGSYRLARCLPYITRACVPLDLILPDQPNRRIRTRTSGGVGGGSCEAPPYPDIRLLRFMTNANRAWCNNRKCVRNFRGTLPDSRREQFRFA